MLRQKPIQNFAVKVSEESNRPFFVYLIGHFVQTSVGFNMWQWNIYNLIDCVNVWKKSEAAKLLTNEYDNFKNLKILKAKLFVSIHIFRAMLQVKNSLKKRYITINVKKVLKPIILLSYAVSKQF